MVDSSIEVLTDTREATAVLAAAFAQDPAMIELFGDDVSNFRGVYDLVVPRMLGNPDSVLLGIRDDQGLVSAAVCQGPGKDPPQLPMLIRGLPMLWRLGPRRVRLLLRFDAQLRKHSPLRSDQLRLAILGTRPDAFGRGYGSALLRRIDEHARARGLGHVYLEAAKDGYQMRLYEKHGYRVEKSFDSVGGPVVVMAKPLGVS
ncbi:MAG: GNAT family N-acetyltransferase [Phycisphaerae bacterium]|nr:GNAT family N-acetyltransferase [Phycisphaerae bacterium]